MIIHVSLLTYMYFYRHKLFKFQIKQSEPFDSRLSAMRLDDDAYLFEGMHTRAWSAQVEFCLNKLVVADGSAYRV